MVHRKKKHTGAWLHPQFLVCNQEMGCGWAQTTRPPLWERMEWVTGPWVWLGCCQRGFGNSGCRQGRSLISVKEPGCSLGRCKSKPFLLPWLLSSVAVSNLSNWQDSWLKAAACPPGGTTGWPALGSSTAPCPSRSGSTFQHARGTGPEVKKVF